MARKTFWKRLLKAGVYGSSAGERDTYTEKDLLDLATNGKKLGKKKVYCPLPSFHHDGDGHLPLPVLMSDGDGLIDAVTSTPVAWDPLINQGFVIDWAYIDDPSAAPADLPNASDNRGWLMGKIEIDEENTKLLDAIKQGRVRSTSLGSLEGYRLPSEDAAEEFEGRVPLHVALTLSPRVDDEAGFIETKDPQETHTVALLSQGMADPTKIVRLSLLDDVKPPMNPMVEKQKKAEEAAQQENENPSEQGEGEGDPSAALASLIAIVNESGIFELPPDTTPDNVIDRLKVLFHNQKQLTGAVDEDEPVGPPPPGSKTQDNKPSLMADTNPTVTALLRGYSIGRKNQRIARAKALAKRSPALKKYIDETIVPMIEAAGEPAALLDDTGAPVIDEATGAPSFNDEPVDTVLATLEAAPADPTGFDISNPDPQSEAHNTPTDFDPTYEEAETDEDKKAVAELLQYTGH